ncbi:MAG: hypothetical protein WC565_03365 [Parcubacteria group bacterium]|jgi:hypothetical protein
MKSIIALVMMLLLLVGLSLTLSLLVAQAYPEEVSVRMVGQNHLIEWGNITDLSQHAMFATGLPYLENVPLPIHPVFDPRGFCDVRTAALPRHAHDPRYDEIDALAGSPFPAFPWEANV